MSSKYEVKLSHLYLKLLRIAIGESDHRHTMNRTSLEKNTAAKFRINRDDMRVVCKELEKAGAIKKINRDKYRLV